MSSGVLWQCALPPAGPSVCLHAAGEDLCTFPFWLSLISLSDLNVISCCFILQRLNVKWQIINQRTSVKWALMFFVSMCFCLCITGFVLKNILMSMATNKVVYSLVDHCIKIFNWVWICFCRGSGDDEEEVVCQESQVTQEMLEEQLVRLVTRELLDLLCKFSFCVLTLFSYKRGKRFFTSWYEFYLFWNMMQNFLSARFAQLSKTWKSSVDLMLLSVMVK